MSISDRAARGGGAGWGAPVFLRGSSHLTPRGPHFARGNANRFAPACAPIFPQPSQRRRSLEALERLPLCRSGLAQSYQLSVEQTAAIVCTLHVREQWGRAPGRAFAAS